jgi:hypothetical protein
VIKKTGEAAATPQLDDILSVTGESRKSNGFRRVFGSIIGGVGNIMLPGIGGAIGAAIGGGVLGAALPTLGGEVTQYLALQRQIQMETLALETASTVMKVRHDAAMSCIRNMK